MFQPIHLPLDLPVLFLHGVIALLGNEADLIADGRQPLVGVVLAAEQAVLRPGGHHAVGLVGPLRHQVVDEDADVALAAV